MHDKEIHVMYGREQQKMTYEILTKAGLAEELTLEMSIGLKPNLVVAKKATEGATTSPGIVEGVIQYLLDHGFKNISIMEGSWVGDDTKRAFRVCGYEDLAKKYKLPLYDLKDDAYVVRRVGDLDIKVCQRVAHIDFLINMPVLKAHCQTLFTCALKNLKGCIPDSEKRRFHSLGLHKPIGYVGKAIKSGFIIVDAIAGDLTFEEGGNPVQMDRIIVGKDPVLVDAYGASLLGYDKEDIEYIGIAERMGVGSANLTTATIHEYDTDLKNGATFKPSHKVKRLTEKVIAKEACSACYGSLVHALQRLDDQGELRSLKEPVYIGQGFRGQVLKGIGVGYCASKCSTHVAGCPPTAKDIIAVLEEIKGNNV